jgi:hypothetical protein
MPNRISVDRQVGGTVKILHEKFSHPYQRAVDLRYRTIVSTYQRSRADTPPQRSPRLDLIKWDAGSDVSEA